MEIIRKGSDLPKKSGGYQASNKNIRKSSYRKSHQLYILLSFDSVRAWNTWRGMRHVMYSVSVYNDYKQQKWKKLPRQVPRLAACY